MNGMNVGKGLSWRMARIGAMSGIVLAGGIATIPGCLDRPIEKVEPRTTTTIVEQLSQSSVDKIDLLLMIDNSRSMADKQQILQAAVPDLIEKLVNPDCGLVNEDGDFVADAAEDQPTGPIEVCPLENHDREFDPVLNIHVGLITSSLGGHGADACDAINTPSENDRGQLIYRLDTTPGSGDVPTYNDLGFLAWDPCAASDECEAKHDPPGESNLNNFVTNLTNMVIGAGEVGCGYEASLESWYRFLIQPDPYDSIELMDTNPDENVTSINAVPQGLDSVLLQQRKDFLRSDSLLAIIMLSDENDCSIRDGGQFYYAAQLYQPGGTTPYHLPRPQITCATDPNSPCCRSCGQGVAADDGNGNACPEKGDECTGSLSTDEDQINLRCWDQKRRFGIDFLYPIDRYVTGLTQLTIQDRDGNLTQNPIFTDLNTDDDYQNVRDAGLVFLAGIVGVPWQDISRRNADGQPDLENGLDPDGNAVGGFQSASELSLNSTWDIILGEPTGYRNCSLGSGTCPTDPLMVESVAARTNLGAHPITGEAVGTEGGSYMENSINGHEYTIAANNDLQYACIFPLASTRDCAGTTEIACDCSDAANNNPLCQATDGTYGQTQYQAKAYPGLRELHVIREIGDQGIVGSICPLHLDEDGVESTYGYRPAIGAIVDRLKVALRGQCLPRSLTPNPETGTVSCLIIEARTVDGDACDCSGNGRNAISEDNQAAVDAAIEGNEAMGWNCFCEITQTTGEDLDACQNNSEEPVLNASNHEVHGWCYVDATTVPPTGNEAIVANCPANEQRIIRFVGDGNATGGATLFITCTGE